MCSIFIAQWLFPERAAITFGESIVNPSVWILMIVLLTWIFFLERFVHTIHRGYDIHWVAIARSFLMTFLLSFILSLFLPVSGIVQGMSFISILLISLVFFNNKIGDINGGGEGKRGNVTKYELIISKTASTRAIMLLRELLVSDFYQIGEDKLKSISFSKNELLEKEDAIRLLTLKGYAFMGIEEKQIKLTMREKDFELLKKIIDVSDFLKPIPKEVSEASKFFEKYEEKLFT